MNTFLSRHKYKLNMWLLVLPVYFFYQSLYPEFPPTWQAKSVSNFEFTPMPFDHNDPYLHHGVYTKDFMLIVNKGEVKNIRQAYLNIGTEPLSLKELELSDEGIMHGSQHGQHVHAISPQYLSSTDKLWLTIQDWQMNQHVVSWELPDALISSPEVETSM